jgi:hypothetical protein
VMMPPVLTLCSRVDHACLTCSCDWVVWLKEMRGKAGVSQNTEHESIILLTQWFMIGRGQQ